MNTQKENQNFVRYLQAKKKLKKYIFSRRPRNRKRIEVEASYLQHRIDGYIIETYGFNPHSEAIVVPLIEQLENLVPYR